MVKDLFNNESGAPGYMVNAGETQPFWSQKQQKAKVTYTDFVLFWKSIKIRKNKNYLFDCKSRNICMIMYVHSIIDWKES